MCSGHGLVCARASATTTFLCQHYFTTHLQPSQSSQPTHGYPAQGQEQMDHPSRGKQLVLKQDQAILGLHTLS